MLRFGVATLHGLFFLSGLCSLALQITWSRMFSTGLGHEMAAVLSVLGAIFAGVAVGASLSQRLLQTTRKPGRWFGFLELIIGFWGLVLVLLIPWCNDAVLASTGLHPSTSRHWFFAFALPAVTLLPATVAMGASFPAMERFISPLLSSGRSVGGLYAASTAGAVLGVLLPVVVALPHWGLTKSLAAIATLSLFTGLAALLVESRIQAPTTEAEPHVQPGGTHLRWTLALTGLLGIGYEILGVRVLARILENTVYTFAAVLVVYLLGTAIGAAAYQATPHRWAPELLRRRLLLLTSIASLTGVWILAHAPQLHQMALERFGSSLGGSGAAEILTAAAVYLWPTLAMGALFSHLVQTAQKQGIGVGRALSLNTVGCALAPLIFGVLLVPRLGAKWSFVGIGLGYLALAWPTGKLERGLSLVPILLIAALPANLWLFSPAPGAKLLSYREGTTDSVAVVEHFDHNRSLLVNNRFTMGGTGAALAERRHASLPLLLHPHPQRALFLGLGTGITFAAAGVHEGLHADGVELVPEIVEALPWFAPHNALPSASGRFQIDTADARRFVRVSREKYDVIVADLFHPARDGAGALYSKEHFAAIRERLAEEGLFCQWLPLFQLNEPMLRVVVRTFLEVFPDGHAFLLRFNVDTPVLGLMSGLARSNFGPDYFRRRVTDPALTERLNAEQIRDGFHLFGCFLAGPAALRELGRGADVNTDDHPIVTFGAPAPAHKRPSARLLDLLDAVSSDVGELIAKDSPATPPFVEALRAFIAARNAYLRGLAADADGNRNVAQDLFLESARLSPDFVTGYAQCLTLAMQQLKTNPQAARRLLQRLAEVRPERPVAGQLLQRLPESPLH